MRKWLTTCLLLFVTVPAWAQSQSATTTGNLNVLNECVAMDVAGMGTGAWQVAGTFVGTVTWTVSANAGDFVAIDAATPAAPGTAVNSTTGTGLWTAAVASLRQMRACMTSYTSGTAEVTLSAAGTGGGSGGGASGGGGEVTNAGTFAIQITDGIDSANVSAGGLGLDVNNTELPTAATETTGVPNAAWTWIKTANYVRNAAGTWDPASPVSDPCDGAKKTIVTINQTTGTQLFTGTASNRTYFCYVHLITAAAQSVGLVSGTGTVCATSTGPLFGGTTAATGWPLTISEGVSLGNGSAMISQTDTDADNVCLLQSASDRLTGVIAYVVAAN